MHIEEFIDSTGVTFPLFETLGGDSLVSLYGVTFTPKYFAICPDKSMRGFNPDYEENIMIFIDSCSPETNVDELENDISVTYFSKQLYLLSKQNIKYKISVVNLSGQIVSSQFYYAETGMNSFDLNLDKGFYIIHIQSEKEGLYSSLKILVE